jgi:hypothetical protein
MICVGGGTAGVGVGVGAVGADGFATTTIGAIDGPPLTGAPVVVELVPTPTAAADAAAASLGRSKR